MDEAPMLFIGEKVGAGGPAMDIAVDPLEGTTLTAKGGPNAMAVVALAEHGNFLHAPDIYMQKIAVGGGLPAGIVDIDAAVGDNLRGYRLVGTIPELFTTLTRAVWSEVYTAPATANADAVRRDLQRAYLDQMTALVVRPAPRTPADARSVARRTLKDLDRRLATAAGSGALNAYMAAHVEESRARIQKALNAGLEAER